MNAEQMEKLVREVIERATSERLADTVQRAHAALDGLDRSLEIWSDRSIQKTTAVERLGEAKARLEQARAEVLLEAMASGAVDGKNAEARALQTTQLLASLEQNGGQYGAAFREVRAAQVACDQAALEETIAEQELKAVHVRCRLLEAMLNALAL